MFKVFKSHLFSQEVLGLIKSFSRNCFKIKFSNRQLSFPYGIWILKLGWVGKQIPNILPIFCLGKKTFIW